MHDIIEKYQVRSNSSQSDRASKHFLVSKKEIVDKDFDLSINRYKSDVYEPISYGDPKNILIKISKLEKELKTGIKQLENLLH